MAANGEALSNALSNAGNSAAAEFFSGKKQTVQLRLDSLCAVKLWLNGKLLTSHELYHAGSRSGFDRYIAEGTLRPGKNLILIKCLLLALNNGISTKTGRQLGTRTGKPEDLKSFEDLWRAYDAQIDYFSARARRSRR